MRLNIKKNIYIINKNLFTITSIFIGIYSLITILIYYNNINSGFKYGILFGDVAGSYFCDEERYPYPHPKFWSKVAKTNIPVLINADAHHPSNIYDDKMELAYKLVGEWGLNLITDYI